MKNRFVVFAFLLLASLLHAEVITRADDARLAGGTRLTFDDIPQNHYTSLVLDDVTITGLMNVSSAYIGQYNTTGVASLQNNSGDGFSFTFTFAHAITAFGFNWGASDGAWTLTALDEQNDVVATFQLPALRESNAGDFFGLAGAGIKTVTITASSYDWVFLDNFTFSTAPIPEPATSAALLGALVLGLAALRRRAAGVRAD